MSKILTLGSHLIHLLDQTEAKDSEIGAARDALLSELKANKDYKGIRDIIILDLHYLVLHLEVIENLYKRLQELEKTDNYIIRWYASMLLMYGGLDKKETAEELLVKNGLTLD